MKPFDLPTAEMSYLFGLYKRTEHSHEEIEIRDDCLLNFLTETRTFWRNYNFSFQPILQLAPEYGIQISKKITGVPF